MRPITIGFLLTLGFGAYIIFTQPHLWFFAMVSAVWAGLAMVQGDAIALLVNKIKQKDMLLELSKLTLEAANEALKAVAEHQASKKEDA